MEFVPFFFIFKPNHDQLMLGRAQKAFERGLGGGNCGKFVLHIVYRLV
jgi:hypothetical protein